VGVRTSRSAAPWRGSKKYCRHQDSMEAELSGTSVSAHGGLGSNTRSSLGSNKPPAKKLTISLKKGQCFFLSVCLHMLTVHIKTYLYPRRLRVTRLPVLLYKGALLYSSVSLSHTTLLPRASGYLRGASLIIKQRIDGPPEAPYNA
jgi:hypothetical protein